MKNLFKLIILITLVITCSLGVFAETIVIVEVDSDMSIQEIQFLKLSYESAVHDNELVLNHPALHSITELLLHKSEYEYNKAMLQFYSAKLESKWQEKSSQYEEATIIWRYLTEELGYNEYVSAGMIGNMMVESGGHTLDIDPYNWDDATGRSFYGICQWGYYFQEVKNQDLSFQLNYLRDTIEEEFYIGGYSYEKFLLITDAREAALVFCRAYERPGSAYEYPRLNCAEIAYSFFTS